MASENEVGSVHAAEEAGRGGLEQAGARAAAVFPASHPLRERFAALRLACPLPPSTGQIADQAFFDDLSGEQTLST